MDDPELDIRFYQRFVEKCDVRHQAISGVLHRFASGEIIGSVVVDAIAAELHTMAGEAALLGLGQVARIAQLFQLHLEAPYPSPERLDGAKVAALSERLSRIAKRRAVASRDGKIGTRDEDVALLAKELARGLRVPSG